MYILNLTIKALFFTNFWIILYTKLLAFLNSRFPAKINQSFLWVQYAPEPFEIPLYLVLTVCFILILFALDKYKPRSVNLPTNTKIILLLLLAALFIYFLGSYPMANEFDPYLSRANQYIYTSTISIYLFTVFIIFLTSFLLRSKKLFLYIFLVIILALITFDARFPMTGHDYEYFIGPSYEVASGKTAYTDILSRYAFLTVDIFALLQKTKLLSLFYIPVVVWLLYIGQYCVIFYLIKKVSKSMPLAFIGLFSILTINYFSLSHLPSTIPQIGPLRWLPMIILLFFVYKSKKINTLGFMATLSFLSLFMIDVGIAMILSFLATLGLLFLASQINLGDLIKSILKFLIFFFLTLLIVNATHLLLGYKFVNVFNILYSLQKHALLGLSLMPIQIRTHFWIVVFIYFATIIYVLTNKSEIRNPKSETISNSQNPNDQNVSNFDIRASNLNLLLFSANLSLFASIYFVGRSHPHNLFHISLFPLLNLFFLIGILYSKISAKGRSPSGRKYQIVKLITLTIVFIIFVIYPAIQRRFTLTEMLITKYKRITGGKIFKSEVNEIISDSYKNEIELITKYIQSNQAIILSVDDSYLFLKTGKKNLLDANPIMGIDLPEDLDFAVKTAIKKCPPEIAVDCSFLGKCPPYTPFIGVNFNLNLLLDKLEKGCGVDYKPIECTSKLCIATS